MKPIQLLLFFFFFIISSLCFSQKKDSLHFKVEYLPNKKYSIESNSEALVEVKYLATDKKLLEELKKQYPKNPTIQTMKQYGKVGITTGNISKDSLFSFSMKIEETNSPSLNGMILNGSCKPGKMPVLASVTAPGLDKKQQQSFISVYQNFLKEFHLPNKKLKTDDAFSISTPITYPLFTGVNIELVIVTNYILKDIKKNVAYLDFTQNYIVKIKEGEIKVTGKGNGKGKVIYNSDDNFTTSSKVNTNLELEMQWQGVKFSTKTKINSETSVNIE